MSINNSPYSNWKILVTFRFAITLKYFPRNTMTRSMVARTRALMATLTATEASYSCSNSEENLQTKTNKTKLALALSPKLCVEKWICLVQKTSNQNALVMDWSILELQASIANMKNYSISFVAWLLISQLSSLLAKWTTLSHSH